MAATDVIRRLIPYSSAALIIAAIYSGYIMYTRYSGKTAEQRLEEQNRERDVKAGAQIVRQYGGDELKILNFAADTRVTKPGGRVLLCFGVANAVGVKIEPEVGPLKPALTRCVETFPKKSTTYTLTAVDGNGKKASASLAIDVRSPTTSVSQRGD